MERTYSLWENDISKITHYQPLEKTSDMAIVIFPGGAYENRAEHEGAGYARFFNAIGINAFVVDYRVSPNRFPDPLSDARRAVRFVRFHAEEFGVDKNKIVAMGSSAGGHLTALLCTYAGEITGDGIDEIGKEDFWPNAQVLCYPVITSNLAYTHAWSYKNLLGERFEERDAFSPEKMVHEKTPQAFIWHTSDDDCVNVTNSYLYAMALRQASIRCEMHIFPRGGHGMGLATRDAHVGQWSELLRRWLQWIGY